MELAGNEKKIQALFRELKVEDERVAPGFVRLWNRAQVKSQSPRRAFKTSFAVATALLVISLCAVAFWWRNWQQGQQQNSLVGSGSVTKGSMSNLTSPSNLSTPPAATPEPKQLVPHDARDRIRFTRQARKLATRRQAELSARNAVIREAVAISSWQSPTVTLMQSPADDVLTSLPQLDRSLSELKTFLPNTPSYQNRER
jgi:hypothetical protein